VAKPASMQMVDTHATDFGNVQKTPCVVQNIYQCILETLNVIYLIVWC
jgi:hypothetical protein